MQNFFPDPGFAVGLRFFLFFNDLPPVCWIEKAGSPFERLPAPAMQCCMGEMVLGKKEHLQLTDVSLGEMDTRFWVQL